MLSSPAVNFAKYLKTAFLNRWNLLALLGGAGFALLSGQADVALPLILAGEAAYVGLLGMHPRFQKYVDAQSHKMRRTESTISSQKMVDHIKQTLPRDSLSRFEALRNQCLELRQIELELRNPGKTSTEMPLEEFHVQGLDRLLWIYLRLLYTQFALAKFFQATSQASIEKNIEQLESRLQRLPKEDASPAGQRARVTVEDNLQTSRSRLENLIKAKENYQLVELEIERLENKIRGLSEMAVNRQEPQFVSNQVDQVAASMLDTERTMNELQFATGLDELEEEAPELLRAKPVITHQG